MTHRPASQPALRVCEPITCVIDSRSAIPGRPESSKNSRTLTALALATLLFGTLAALGVPSAPKPDPQAPSHAADAARAADLDANDEPPRQRAASRRQWHSLRMPFFSFQPLG